MGLAFGFAFIFGTIIGSFLNVLIVRYGTDASPLTGRSRCPHCGRTLPPRDLVPLFSFLFLKGRCRSCHTPIAWQYPIVEFAMGMGMMLLAFQLGFGISFWLASTLLAISIVIIGIDMRHYIIPDRGVAAIALVGFLWQINLGEPIIPNVVLGLVVGAGMPLFLIAITRGKGMGLGDAKLAGALGILVGWPLIVVAFFLAVFLGAGVGSILLLNKTRGLKDPIPFGPFLLIGTALAMIWGNDLANFYLRLL